jgi:hypothetical protein
MTMMELATCRVPEDPTSTPPSGGYVVACVTIYERGFAITSISPLPIAVLWLGATSPDSFGNPSYCSLHDPV